MFNRLAVASARPFGTYGQRHDSSWRHAAPLNNCKYRWLQPVATINSRSIACKVSWCRNRQEQATPGSRGLQNQAGVTDLGDLTNEPVAEIVQCGEPNRFNNLRL